jgi:hypothetical protein
VDYVYVWADGIHVNIRLDEEKLCLLVMVGVRVDGTKELIDIEAAIKGHWDTLEVLREVDYVFFKIGKVRFDDSTISDLTHRGFLSASGGKSFARARWYLAAGLP